MSWHQQRTLQEHWADLKETLITRRPWRPFEVAETGRWVANQALIDQSCRPRRRDTGTQSSRNMSTIMNRLGAIGATVGPAFRSLGKFLSISDSVRSPSDVGPLQGLLIGLCSPFQFIYFPHHHFGHNDRSGELEVGDVEVALLRTCASRLPRMVPKRVTALTH